MSEQGPPVEIDVTALCCGHHLASHDRYEDGQGPQGCGHINCDCTNSFTEAFAERAAQIWEAGANAAVELHNTGTSMTLRARIPFPADENPYRTTAPAQPS